MSDLAQFRADTRAWLEENCPPSMREPVRSDKDATWGGRNATYANPDQKIWLDRMAARGWTVPDWPTAYGGGGLSPAEAKILREEMAAINARNPLYSFGISMLGPALLKYGTEEQKLEHLPKIARGEIRWCQGYSEPGAGSDLAGLQTSAVEDGDDFIVNGQKVWTSYADKADWIFCLVRTDRSTKQGGISFLLFDMASPGVATRPIKLISGNSPFCETFFDDVRVPKTNLIGERNKGWDVAKYLLGHEREMISGMGLTDDRPLIDRAVATVGHDDQGRLADPMLRATLATFDVRARAFAAMSERFIDELKANRAHPAQPSMMKYVGTELNKTRHELMMAAGGSDLLEWEGSDSRDGAEARAWLRTKANSIEGGTSEIQLNIIARRILDLPTQ
ncbi:MULTISPECIES: acyl-CoA dehydrogenase family protein [Sphingomonas]|jgi:alkylation response protein AidB-like acyl-CoA dehydrogenase|uniref:Acyl-CoA dehydrogenase n=1 Tax=Sphingomonas hankookensis TaxID=563996 RepID=A0ABR5YE63_9SPHN|nr:MULTISPECIES: acyl-CoA dehydrogenase family protein [Sphingomonas]KZE17262.1 acyl-CoA dehydrogenase [Sphingomonas hankookensis]PZT96478.1 MAG: acyl-CoA dehydrogenase [Sphingomonas sp.]WCP71115.1 acyl-CoA dehydrogenase family protein [Sphingomonas hankookensis]